MNLRSPKVPFVGEKYLFTWVLLGFNAPAFIYSKEVEWRNVGGDGESWAVRTAFTYCAPQAVQDGELFLSSFSGTLQPV